MSFQILSTGSYVPERVVTNEDLMVFLDTSDEWIVERTGVHQRRVSTDETAADMAYKAAVRALEAGNTKPEELDMIFCATVSGEDISPSVSCMVQNRLGVKCPSMDINAACSAFIYMLETVAGFFARGKVKKILVIGAERMSRIVNWEDRNTCILFGDGSGALLLGEGDNLLGTKLVTKGGDDVIKIPNFVGKSPFWKGAIHEPYIHMNGQETFKFAVNEVNHNIRDILKQCGLGKDDISHVVLHQANLRIIDWAIRRMDIPPEKFYTNIQNYGNTSSASIPIALDEMNRKGMLQRGENLLLCAFGGGLSSAACVLRW